MAYWSLIGPIWESISIYDGPDAFLSQYAKAPEPARILFAAHWCQSEICNGGFDQFFSNSTGVLAPEGVSAFRTIGMPRTAETIQKAISFFGRSYPRDRAARNEALDALNNDVDELFEELDTEFYSFLELESGGFQPAADAYAASNG